MTERVEGDEANSVEGGFNSALLNLSKLDEAINALDGYPSDDAGRRARREAVADIERRTVEIREAIEAEGARLRADIAEMRSELEERKAD